MKTIKKMIAALLALAMCAGFPGIAALADGGAEPPEPAEAGASAPEFTVTVTEVEITDADGNVIGAETTTVTEYAPVTEVTGTEAAVTETTEAVTEDGDGNPAVSKTTTTTETTTETATTTVETTATEGRSEKTGAAAGTEIAAANSEERTLSPDGIAVEGAPGETVTVAYGVNDVIVDQLLDGEYTADESYTASEDEDGNTVYTKTGADGAEYTWTGGELYGEDGSLIGYIETETKVTVETETAQNDGMTAEALTGAGYAASKTDANVYVRAVEETLEDGTIVTTVTTVDLTKNTTETTTTTTEATTNLKWVSVDEAGQVTVTFGSAVSWSGHGTMNVSGLRVDSGSFVPDGKSSYHAGTDIVKDPDAIATGTTTVVSGYLRGLRLGAESAINAYGGTNQYEVQQVVLADTDGNKYYAYCIDPSVQYYGAGTYYKLTDMDSIGYIGKEAVQNVAAIAENGYWGASEGAGSMDAFKDWLRALGYEGDLDGLTPGIAESVTAAALWHYSASKEWNVTDSGVLKTAGTLDDPAWTYYIGGSSFKNYIREEDAGQMPSGWNFYSTGNAEKDAALEAKLDLADALYQAIVGAGDAGVLSAGAPTDYLDPGDVGSPTATVKEQTADGYYKTDLSFEIDADFDNISFTGASGSGVYVKDATGAWVFGTIEKTGDGKVAVNIPDILVQAGGAALTIQIRGKQTIPQSAQLVQYWTGNYNVSQTLVTVVEGTRDVWMGFTMKLDAVSEAKVSVNTQTKVETAVEVTEVKVWAGEEEVTTRVVARDTEISEDIVYTYPEPGPEPEPKPERESESEPEIAPQPDSGTQAMQTPAIPAAGPVVELPDEPVPLTGPAETAVPPNGSAPLTEAPETVELPDEPVPLAGPSETVELPDETVPPAEPSEMLRISDDDAPLAPTPRTGDDDSAALWRAVALISLMGLGGLTATRKHEDHH